VTDQLRVALLDVGHGVCVVLASGQEALMVDCPPSPAVERWLRRNGISRVAHLIISHFDQDHCAGFGSLVNSGIAFQHLWFTDDQQNNTRAYLHLAAVLSDTERRGTMIPSSYPHSLAGPIEWNGVFVEWILPNRGRRMLRGNRNSLSVVCRIRLPNHRAILCLSDVDFRGWRYRDLAADIRADWVIAAHHGGRARTRPDAAKLMDDVLIASEAKYVFFSIARNRYRLPLAEVAQAAARTARIACSQISKHCLADLNSVVIPEKNVSVGGRRMATSSCAGTVELRMEPASLSWADEDLHAEMVSALPARLCHKDAPDLS
jgi:beta-lactamase superfamily II metal-dependent hydrolase